MTTEQVRGPATAPTISFDHHSPEYARNWREINADLRERCPVARTDAHGGFTLLTRYADVAAVIKDDATFACRHDPTPGSIYQGVAIPPSPMVLTPLEMDPPEYGAYRKALNPWFSPAKTRTFEPFARSVTTALLDAVIETGSMDVVEDLASPLPAILTAKLLGLPLEDWRIYAEASHELVAFAPGTPEFDTAVGKNMAMLERCFQTIVARRVEPADDLLTLIGTMEIDGERLSDQQVMEMCMLVINGGNDTTTGLLAHALAWLSARPEQRAWLAADLSRIPLACEEFLRYFSIVQAQARTTTTDAEIGGCPVKAGDRVLMSLASANHDPAVFDRPDEVVLDRFPNRHQSFGLGVHRCIGSNIARMQFRVAMEEILTRMPDLTVDVTAARPYPNIGTINGWIDMPATFTPGTRLGSDFVLV